MSYVVSCCTKEQVPIMDIMKLRWMTQSEIFQLSLSIVSGNSTFTEQVPGSNSMTRPSQVSKRSVTKCTWRTGTC
jgi:hypothetical protein